MIKYIKNDFKMVREALNYKVGKEVPFGIFLLYYIVVGAIVLPFWPIAWVYCKYKIWRMKREFQK